MKSNNPNAFAQPELIESENLYLSASQIPGAGRGLFTSTSIAKGEIIAYYEGEVLTYEEANKRAEKGLNKYFVDTLDGFILDSMNVDCFAKYANDAATASSKTNFKTNAIISILDDDRVGLIAKRKIAEGEEIFCSYGKGYWKEQEK